MISWPFIILFGDSITQFALETNGWGATIANKLVRKCDVLNRGLSGYNTRWAKLILPELISKNSEHAAAVTIFFGANDSSLKEENPQQHVPLEEYIENLRSMIQYLKTVGITEDKIILITPPPLHEPSWEKQCYIKGYNLNRLNSATGAYAKACVQVGSESGTDVVDLWTLMQEGGQDYREYLSDGLHLSDQGNQFLESNLWPLLEKKLGALPFLLPYWNDVDNNPESSLLSITAKAEAYLATDPATAQTLIQDAALTIYITFPSIGYGEDDVDGGLTDLYQLLGVGWKETKDVISWWEV